MRADGKKVKGMSAIERAVPYIMSKRVDAQQPEEFYRRNCVIVGHITLIKINWLL